MNSSLAVEGEITPSMSFDETATLSEEVGNARSSLHAAIEARKQTERDAQLLLNRIQLLRNEEAKALKNVAVTRTKVNQISSVKRDAAAREAERNQVERMREERSIQNQERNQYLREVSKAAREHSKQQAEQTKLRSAFETKQALQRRIDKTDFRVL